MRLDDIISVLGPVDEALAAQINRTGATPEELAQAWAWFNADEALVNEGRPLPSGWPNWLRCSRRPSSTSRSEIAEATGLHEVGAGGAWRRRTGLEPRLRSAMQ